MNFDWLVGNLVHHHWGFIGYCLIPKETPRLREMNKLLDPHYKLFIDHVFFIINRIENSFGRYHHKSSKQNKDFR